jgi:hypothetical protein
MNVARESLGCPIRSILLASGSAHDQKVAGCAKFFVAEMLGSACDRIDFAPLRKRVSTSARKWMRKRRENVESADSMRVYRIMVKNS